MKESSEGGRLDGGGSKKGKEWNKEGKNKWGEWKVEQAKKIKCQDGIAMERATKKLHYKKKRLERKNNVKDGRILRAKKKNEQKQGTREVSVKHKKKKNVKKTPNKRNKERKK